MALRRTSIGTGPKVKTLFIGSTVKDLENYRREVQSAVLKRAEVASFLSEDWVGGYDDTVTRCKAKLAQCDGYFGIFGYWYGSIPPGKEQSITHLEFSWAWERWGKAPAPRMAIFMPRVPSAAKDELEAAASDLLRNKSPAETKLHAEQLSKFHSEVSDTWRTVNPFESLSELRELAITTCLTWELRLAKLANQPAGTPTTRSPTSVELGQLGRQKHFKAVKRILSRLPGRPEVPAVAMVVTGDEDAGQKEHLDALVQLKQLRVGRPPDKGRPTLMQYGVDALLSWIVAVSGGDGSSAEGIETLAEYLHRGLRNQQYVFLLDEVHRFAGGLTGFRENFWKPLYARLELLRQNESIPNRLIFFVVDYLGDPGASPGVSLPTPEDPAEADYSRLLALPELGPISEDDLYEWLDEMDVPDVPAGRRAQIVAAARTNPAGALDPTPRRVLDRLRREDLGLTGEHDD